jgi:hypothetical protein
MTYVPESSRRPLTWGAFFFNDCRNARLFQAPGPGPSGSRLEASRLQRSPSRRSRLVLCEGRSVGPAPRMTLALLEPRTRSIRSQARFSLPRPPGTRREATRERLAVGASRGAHEAAHAKRAVLGIFRPSFRDPRRLSVVSLFSFAASESGAGRAPRGPRRRKRAARAGGEPTQTLRLSARREASRRPWSLGPGAGIHWAKRVPEAPCGPGEMRGHSATKVLAESLTRSGSPPIASGRRRWDFSPRASPQHLGRTLIRSWVASSRDADRRTAGALSWVRVGIRRHASTLRERSADA